MRILMRGATDPLYAMDPAKFIIENHTGGNIGNMTFTHSIAKSLLTDADTVIDYVNTAKQNLDRYYADYVNDNYDYFIIPLANAFKVKGHEELTKLAVFVKMLKIPCAIIGVSIQQMLSDTKFVDSYKYNDEVKELIGAVLSKSPMIGVRGEMTADYLGDLGFKAEKDYTVIGCPSMYTFGNTIPEAKSIKLCESSVVSFNSKVEYENREVYKPFVEFSKRNMKAFPNMVYVQQQIDDIRMIYLDRYKRKLRENKVYDISKAISFVDVPSWINYLKENVDFSIGTRTYGTITAVLAGVPAVTIPFDKRIFEITQYHNIPVFDADKITDKTTLYDIFEQADFTSVQKGHRERFEHYLDFLHKLGLDTVYDHKYEDGKTPYELKIAEQNFSGVIKAYDVCDEAEQFKRYRDAFPIVKKIQADERKRAEKLSEEIEELKAEIDELKVPKKGLFKKNK